MLANQASRKQPSRIVAESTSGDRRDIQLTTFLLLCRSFTDFPKKRNEIQERIQITMNATQSVPRFLLPRLSWTGPLSTTTSIPGASVVVFRQARDAARGTGWQAAPRRSLHTADPTSTRRYGVLRDNTNSPPPTRSLSSIVRNPVLRRSFHASAPLRRDHHFDTLRFVQRLQEEGFTEEQSVAMMKVLNDVIAER
jgi:hypothetical protein